MSQIISIRTPVTQSSCSPKITVMGCWRWFRATTGITNEKICFFSLFCNGARSACCDLMFLMLWVHNNKWIFFNFSSPFIRFDYSHIDNNSEQTKLRILYFTNVKTHYHFGLFCFASSKIQSPNHPQQPTATHTLKILGWWVFNIQVATSRQIILCIAIQWHAWREEAFVVRIFFQFRTWMIFIGTFY